MRESLIREKREVDKVNKALIGLVLAGGQSRRMGQDKALMRYQGATLIEHASSLLKAAGCDEVLISRNAPNFLNDKIDDAGPLGGVHAALEVLCNSNAGKGSAIELLVLPVDMPQMTPQLLKALVSAGREAQRSVYVENRFLPFYLSVMHNTNAMLTHYLVDQNKRRVVGFLETLDAVALEEANFTRTKRVNGDQEKQSDEITRVNEAQWLNVNTPDDWPDDK
ncbi:molybdenum cofactor guanylyltransferase [Alteromonas sp. BL110]|nr:molybdenum cofactor guanylyltransferase [Alteromonas sp. BL110]RKM79884.1 molybdenum cofactor guanylyltransferase [Alteromonas sp. BL110]